MNRLAPYKDPAVIELMGRFNETYKIPVQRHGLYTKEADWDMYRHYLKWVVETDDDEVLAATLNKPQFDKVFQVYCATMILNGGVV